jgi:DNA-directed RNA polymerase subunit RPC12/RpoP
MLTVEFKCQKCGLHFHKEVLDREDPNERYVQGAPLRCPNCNSMLIERLQTLRRVRSGGLSSRSRQQGSFS